MLLWVIFALMTAAVVATLLHPLLRRPIAVAPGADGVTAVYRDQLAEIEAEAGRGLIGPEEAEAARREIARRLIAHAPEAVPAPSAPVAGSASSGRLALAVLLGACMPAVALGLYLLSGSPGLPSQPLAARKATPPVDAQMAKLISAVEARLAEHPEDGRGWDVIAPVYLRLARYNQAADAYRRAVRLVGETPRRLAGLAESLMLESGGRIGDEARSVLARLLVLEPDHVQARFWLTFAKEQDGNLAEAASEYAKLLAGAPADAPWRPMLEERLQAVRAALGGQTASGPGPSAAAKPNTETIVPGPGADDIAAAERKTPAERQAMIEGMVAGLAARLEKDGRDLAGWQRLIRALTVLGRKDEAVAALGRARKSFVDEPQSLAALADLARSLGLGT
ncbi:MAG: c-type cytochrome biogenesis protein CcmI [Hyphomicrobiaceae bacterium]